MDRILSNDYLYLTLFTACTPRVLFILGRTCQLARLAVLDYVSSVWNINRALQRFFDDPLAFRSLQSTSGLLISGSFALQFLSRQYWADSDLDLYLPVHSFQRVGQWLMHEGYTFCPAPRQPHQFEDNTTPQYVFDNPYVPLQNGSSLPYRSPGIYAVFTFLKPRNNLLEPLKVQLIVAHRSPMEVILKFHSSKLASCSFSFYTFTIVSLCHEHSIL